MDAETPRLEVQAHTNNGLAHAEGPTRSDEFKRFFERSVDLFCIAGTDGYFHRVNPAFTQTLGYDEEELLHRPFLDFIHPDDLPDTLEEVKKLSDGVPTIHFENRYRHREGHYIWLSWTAQPAAQGILYAVARDVTKQKHAEAAQQRIQARLDRVLEGTSDGLWDGRLDTYETWYSRRFRAMIHLPETAPLDGYRFMEMVVEADRPVVYETIRRHTEEGVPYECTFRVRCGDGHIRWFRGCGKTYPDRDAQGPFLRMAGSLQDVDFQKRVEEEMESRITARTQALQTANDDLSAFVYTVSHDLRAPLRAVEGFSRILLNRFDGLDSEQHRHYLQRIHANAQHMATLMEDLLRFSRLGRSKIKRATVDLQALAGAVWAEQQETLGHREVRMTIDAIPAGEGDERLLYHVLLNLIGNAIKYTTSRKEANIQVGAEEQDGTTIYFVRDNGVGFDMRYAQRLFEVFQRLHRSDAFEGNGVGLAIVHRIITRHGGAVWAEATPGQGATFFFTLTPYANHGRASR